MHKFNENLERRSKALGLFSLALGLAELTAPGQLARTLRIRPDTQTKTVLRAFGAREILAGVAILAKPREATGMWSRVLGDALDLATLAAAVVRKDAPVNRIGPAAAGIAAITLLDVATGWQLEQANATASTVPRGVMQPVHKAITIGCTPQAAYDLWRKLENLPRFMTHLKSVDTIDAQNSRWTAHGPAGVDVSWNARILEDIPGERLSWASTQGSDITNSGSVTFKAAPGGRGTEVRVRLAYAAPAGVIGKAAAKLLFSEPAQQINGDLRRFKQVMELGDVVHSESSVKRPLTSSRPPRAHRFDTTNLGRLS